MKIRARHVTDEPLLVKHAPPTVGLLIEDVIPLHFDELDLFARTIRRRMRIVVVLSDGDT